MCIAPSLNSGVPIFSCVKQEHAPSFRAFGDGGVLSVSADIADRPTKRESFSSGDLPHRFGFDLHHLDLTAVT